MCPPPPLMQVEQNPAGDAATKTGFQTFYRGDVVECCNLTADDEGIDIERLRAVVYNVAFQQGAPGDAKGAERRKILVLWCRVLNIFFLANWAHWGRVHQGPVVPLEEMAAIDAAWKVTKDLEDVKTFAQMNKATQRPAPQMKACRDEKKKAEREKKKLQDKEEKKKQEKE